MPAAKTNYIKMSCKIFVCWQRSVIVVSVSLLSLSPSLSSSFTFSHYVCSFGSFNADFAKSFSGWPKLFFGRQAWVLELLHKLCWILWKIYIFHLGQ